MANARTQERGEVERFKREYVHEAFSGGFGETS